MNKIRSIKQLKTEQRKLEQRKNELEKAIRYDWLEVRESVKPKNVAKQLFARIFDKEPQDKNSLANTLSELAAVFTKVAVKKAEEKVTRWMSNKK